jgi:hypothetical protein
MSKESKSNKSTVKAEWILSDLVKAGAKNIKITGAPGSVKYQESLAVSFNGSSDGITIDEMPIKGLNEFTIELIFNPASGGSFEQRFLHAGEVQGDRVLLELRANPTHWYSDAFIKTGEDQLALIDPGQLHPLDKWYHLAYVNDNGKFSVYVNGKLELEGHLNVAALKSGKTSVGMRQNEVSWFRGAVYKIRVSAAAVKPEGFLKF